MISKKMSEYKKPPVAITTIMSKNEQWTQTVKAVGQVTSNQSTQVTSQISGQVKEINFKSGQTVSKGDVIVQLDDSLLKSKYNNQLAKVKLSKIELERQLILLKTNSTARNSVDKAQAQYAAQSADLEYIASEIDFMSIKAPFAGKLGIRTLNVGDYINPGSLIVDLESINDNYIDISVAESFQPLLVEGQKVTFSNDAYKGKTFTATISAIQPSSNQQSHNINVRAKVEGEGNQLVNGMYINAEIVLNKTVSIVPVPKVAISYSLYGDSVYVVTTENGQKTVQQKLIKVGPRQDDQIGILSGLKQGEEIVTSNQQQLKKGTVVKVNNSRPFPTESHKS
ncbi:efflux RND transporter periplasmic adaptor subunit [Vibrio superstes]|uniref:MexH family multidrug efflux RND transporter periplasmic adaptor subunit n=1 Tax=Vibrio superstes NBRC 103154 TaxID=1219062 RepID=A0A511QSC5_9VIBR|nr:efflux RND transporter periplasmic adaptor subunit [Vibrio superstes]GEM80254.1 MexH family multidrug efflux RND transporter periplasmic adaptor subunit [Vibrio superstes NBRC 103154]